MTIPLYGFLEGDTIGLLIMAEENETVGELCNKLQQAASVRVAFKQNVKLIYNNQTISANLTVAQAGLKSLHRFDVREERSDGI